MDEELSNRVPLFTTGQEFATFVASCGILHKAWEEICKAHVNRVDTFVVKEDEGVVYVTFPSLYTEDFIVKDSKYGECKIQDENTVFSHSLKSNDDKPALVHKGALRRFLRILEISDFNSRMSSFMSLKREQTVVFVGHSLGGAVATLATIWFLEKRIRQISPFCITFGSPFVGDASLGEAIGREDWSGCFFNVVSKYDIVPRMLLAPSESIAQPLTVILAYWGSIMGKASMEVSSPPDQEACKSLLKNVLQHTSTTSSNYTEESGLRSMYRPIGTYMFCSTHGAACIGDPEAVLKMLHFTIQCNEGKTFDEIASVCILEHTDYGNLLEYITEHLLNTIAMGITNAISDSSYETGIALELDAMGIEAQNDDAFHALKKVEEKKGTFEMNIEELNVTLSKNQSAMAELEWFKGLCKVQGIGYYDFFKHQNDQKTVRIEMLRTSLETFWDSIVEMVEKHELPIDIQFQNKWINAGTAYRRLVEPLDIAYFYGKQKGNDPYLSQGIRPRRHIVLEKWMNEKEQTRIGTNKKPRTKFASLTQDSCFWAHVEEACKDLRKLQQKKEQQKVMNAQLKESLEKFEDYVWSMIRDRSISVEVFLEQSSFMQWWQQYRHLQLQSEQWKSSSSLLKFMEDENWKLEI
ncbi:hypothetical protein SUGI_0192420 [Cryptomeria japonica]|uniref:protein EDS1B n=1 Tax=Cryptomeria japonica TaxID=3369 RepID=UPI002408DAFC|nr:protein EDS1B [Cryptomeria japonica]GLJ12514.1 hypothetical protein SUGI_0192420 [Cryptomeria japonica]